MHNEFKLTQRAKSRITRSFALVAIVAMTVMSVPFRPATAANLTEAKDYLSRQQAGVTAGITHEIFFKTATAVSGGEGANKIIFSFPNSAANNTKWCRTANSLTVVGITNATGVATSESATALPGGVDGASLAGTCAQSTPDTFTITGIDNLSANTKYGLRVSANTAVLGTGDAANDIKILIKTNNGTIDIDQFTVATSLVTTDQYTITASIDATLTVVLSATTVNLGTLSATNINYQGVTSTVSTSAVNGYVSMVKYSGALSNGIDTIANSGATVTKGTSGFGASTSASTQTINTSDASPACSTTLQTSAAGPFVSTTLTTALQQFSSAAGPVATEATTLCFLASIVGTQAPGSYSTVVTLVTTAKF